MADGKWRQGVVGEVGGQLHHAGSVAGLADAAALAGGAYTGHDPRAGITAAYHALLATLAAAGAPREPQEAPHEHPYRAFGPPASTPSRCIA
jgi:hypothetical protein